MLTPPCRTPASPASAPLQRQRALLRRLECAWERQGCRFQRIEAHMSWVYVPDQLAYKVKKALRFDVLDYATPAWLSRSAAPDGAAAALRAGCRRSCARRWR